MKRKKGKIMSIFSTKGGVGKTVLALSLGGIYSLSNKKVLLLDADLCSGGIAVSLNIDTKRTIYNLCDDLNNKRYNSFFEYVSSYNENIDVLSCPFDPRQSNKIDAKDLEMVIDLASNCYDVVLIDTNHFLNANNLMILDKSDSTLLIVTNDPVDLKNMKSLIATFKDIDKDNYKVVLNSSRDTDKDYLSLFDIKNTIKNNIDFSIEKSFHIKNIDKYTLDGEILSLNKKIRKIKKKDIKKLTMIANEIIGGDDSE